MNREHEYVFIVGCPRSGKTLLQSLLAFHDNFAWFSQYCSRFSSFPEVGALNRAYDFPTVGNLFLKCNEKVLFPHPVEMPKYYNKKLRGKGSLTKRDVTNVDKKKIWVIQGVKILAWAWQKENISYLWIMIF
jgi:hypothetical protein